MENAPRGSAGVCFEDDDVRPDLPGNARELVGRAPDGRVHDHACLRSASKRIP
jgi:hypothetical protein